jgi:hypothetical protein
MKISGSTKTAGKTGIATDFTKLKEGESIDRIQIASVVRAHIE